MAARALETASALPAVLVAPHAGPINSTTKTKAVVIKPRRKFNVLKTLEFPQQAEPGQMVSMYQLSGEGDQDDDASSSESPYPMTLPIQKGGSQAPLDKISQFL